jgi:hypothetical protein
MTRPRWCHRGRVASRPRPSARCPTTQWLACRCTANAGAAITGGMLHPPSADAVPPPRPPPRPPPPQPRRSERSCKSSAKCAQRHRAPSQPCSARTGAGGCEDLQRFASAATPIRASCSRELGHRQGLSHLAWQRDGAVALWRCGAGMLAERRRVSSSTMWRGNWATRPPWGARPAPIRRCCPCATRWPTLPAAHRCCGCRRPGAQVPRAA